MSSSEFATLEEAFGVASFLAPEPPVLRGDVGMVNDARHKQMASEIKTIATFQKPKETPSVGPQRLPEEVSRTQVVASPRCRPDDLARAHARGGAAAAWDLVPACARADMMWFAIKECFDADVMLLVFAGVLMLLLLK
jgi:hypothetical protein